MTFSSARPSNIDSTEISSLASHSTPLLVQENRIEKLEQDISLILESVKGLTEFMVGNCSESPLVCDHFCVRRIKVRCWCPRPYVARA